MDIQSCTCGLKTDKQNKSVTTQSITRDNKVVGITLQISTSNYNYAKITFLLRYIILIRHDFTQND